MKTRLTSIAFLIIIISCINPANAIIYTFDHVACSTEDPNVCICDTYDSATDTCTITGTHTYQIDLYDIYSHYAGKKGDNLILNYNHIIVLPTGVVSVVSEINQYGSSSPHISSGNITINSNTLDISGTVSADGGDGHGLHGACSGGTITVNSDSTDISGSISTEGGDGQVGNRHAGSGGKVTINSDTINIRGSITTDGGDGASTGSGADININGLSITISGTISADSGFNGYYHYHSGKTGSININSKSLGISGSITANTYCNNEAQYFYKCGPIIINSSTINISGNIESTGATHSGGFSRDGNIEITSSSLYISSNIKGRNLQIEAPSHFELDNPGSINAYNILINTNADLKIMGSISSEEYVRISTPPKSIIEGSITGKDIAINTNTLQVDSGSISASNRASITYCTLNPSICEIPDACTQISGGQISMDKSCAAVFQPTPTLLSLQGTITDTLDNPIDGAVTVTSLEKCADTTCAAKTSEDISAAANDISFTGGIVNSMVGPYDLIMGTTYMITVKVCNLFGLCDEDIQIRFTD